MSNKQYISNRIINIFEKDDMERIDALKKFLKDKNIKLTQSNINQLFNLTSDTDILVVPGILAILLTSKKINLTEDRVKQILNIVKNIHIFYVLRTIKILLNHEGITSIENCSNDIFNVVMNIQGVYLYPEIIETLLDKINFTAERMDIIFYNISHLPVEDRVVSITFLINNLKTINLSQQRRKLSFNDIITKCGIEDSIDLIFVVIKNSIFNNNDKLTLLLSFINEHNLYNNNDTYKTYFLLKAIEYNIINRENVHLLNNTFKNYHDNDLLRDMINTLYQEKIITTDLDTLNLLRGRSKRIYNFLSIIVGNNKELKDVLIESGIKSFKNLFGAGNINDITILDVISYVDIANGLNILHGYFNKEMKERLKDNFEMSDKYLILREREIEKLTYIMYGDNTDTNRSKIIKKLYRVGDITSYLRSNLPKIPSVNESHVNDYQLSINSELMQGQNILNRAKAEKIISDEIRHYNHSITDAEKEEKINLKVNELSNDDLNKSFRLFLKSATDITPFLDIMLGEEWKVNSDNKDKIITICEELKNELCYLFRKKDMLTNFIVAIHSSDDGCVHNLGNQMKRIIYTQLFSGDITKSILFDILSNKVICPILNSGGDIIHTNDDFLNHSVVNEAYISASGLLGVLSEAMTYKEVYSIIDKYLNDDSKYAIFLKDDSTFIKSCMNEFASYLLIKNTAPDLLKQISQKEKEFYIGIEKEIAGLQNAKPPVPSPIMISLAKNPDTIEESKNFIC